MLYYKNDINNRKSILTLILLISIIFSTTACEKKKGEGKEKKVLTQAKTLNIDKNSNNTSFIKTTGAVFAETQIDATATTRGTIRSIHFQIGDKIQANKILASLYDNTTLSGLNNAQTNKNNMASNLVAIDRITNEAIRRTELGVQAANEQIESAKIGLFSAKTNLKNAKTLKEKGNLDSKNQALILYNNYLNIISTILDDVNYIIHTDKSEEQIPGIKNVLSAKNKSALLDAKNQYCKTEDNLIALQKKVATLDNIEGLTNKVNLLFTKTKILVDNTITVLNNTVSSTSFTDAILTAQKTKLTTSRNLVVNYQLSTKTTLQNLQNQTPNYNQEIDTLKNAVTAAQNRLTSANTGYEDALVNLKNTKQNKEQRLIASKSSLDSAQGQLNLAQIQTNDLSIKALISGEITQKYVELGTEVNPGQKIAQISQTYSVKISIELPANNTYRIDKDAIVKIGKTMKGKISFINPIADSISKKVQIKIVYNNEEKDLIPGTFIDVQVPTKQREKSTAGSIYVPIKAVNITQNEKIVYILENGEAKKVLVKTALTDGKTIEVTTGLKQDDQLIIEGNKPIEDEEKVKLVK